MEWGDQRGRRWTCLQDASGLSQFHTRALCFSTGKKGWEWGAGERGEIPWGARQTLTEKVALDVGCLHQGVGGIGEEVLQGLLTA